MNSDNFSEEEARNLVSKKVRASNTIFNKDGRIPQNSTGTITRAYYHNSFGWRLVIQWDHDSSILHIGKIALLWNLKIL